MKFLVKGEMTKLFTQDDINKGKIRLSHQQQLDAYDDIDVIVLQVVLKFITLFISELYEVSGQMMIIQFLCNFIAEII